MNQEQTSPVTLPKSKLESWAFGILTTIIFLVPIMFIPVPFLQQIAVKGYLIIFGVLGASVLYMISKVKQKSLEWISHPLSYLCVIFVIVLVLSSATSGNFMTSFFGKGFEYGTASFMLILCIGGWLTTVLSSRNPQRAISVYMAIMASFVFLAIYQAIKLVNPTLLSFGLFSASTSTPVGSWYDLGIFSGVIFIVTCLSFIYAPTSRMVKYIVGILCAASFFYLVLVGLPIIWFGIALVFLAVNVQIYINKKKSPSFGGRMQVFAVIVFVIAALFSWKGNIVSAPIVNVFHAGYSELHLPWQMTLDIGTGVIKSSPILGSGPNTFAKEYLLYKPAAINGTQFWSAGFDSGSGLVPTLAISLGLCGIVLLCLLYVYFIGTGVQVLKRDQKESDSEKSTHDKICNYLSYSSFFVGAFLLFMDFVYVPSYTVIFLTFVLIGIFIGSCIRSGNIRLLVIPANMKASLATSVDVPVGGQDRKGKSSVYGRAVSIIVLLVLAAAFVFFGLKALALGYFTVGAEQISVSSPSSSVLNSANGYFHKALALDPLDIYDQAIVQTDLSLASVIITKISAAGSNAKPSQDEIKQIGALLNDAGIYAVAAVKRDPSNYYNYMVEAQVSSAAVALQMQGAYDAAVAAFANAAKIDPYDPSIYLSAAQLAANQGKYDDATSYIGSALQLKNNYSDAVYLLSQIQVAQGKTADAIISVKFATQLNPNDPTVFYQLGLLQYNAAQYSDAVTSLSKAVSLNPQFANAQYFLGLSYVKVGNNADAIAQFQALAKSNPDNSDVASILANLQQGKAPFVNQKPPVSTPEKRSSPPIGDQITNRINNVTAKSSAAK